MTDYKYSSVGWLITNQWCWRYGEWGYVKTVGDITPPYQSVGNYTIDFVKVQYYWQDEDTQQIYNLHTVDAVLTHKVVDGQPIVSYEAESSALSVVPCCDLRELVIIYYRDAGGGLNNWAQGAWYPDVTLHRISNLDTSYYAPYSPQNNEPLYNDMVELVCGFSWHCEEWDWEVYRNNEQTPVKQFTTNVYSSPYNTPVISLVEFAEGDIMRWRVRGRNRHAGSGPWSDPFMVHNILQRPKVEITDLSYSWLNNNTLRLTATRQVTGDVQITWQALRYNISNWWVLQSKPVGDNPMSHDFFIEAVPSQSFQAEALINYSITVNGLTTNYQATKNVTVQPSSGGGGKGGGPLIDL